MRPLHQAGGAPGQSYACAVSWVTVATGERLVSVCACVPGRSPGGAWPTLLVPSRSSPGTFLFPVGTANARLLRTQLSFVVRAPQLCPETGTLRRGSRCAQAVARLPRIAVSEPLPPEILARPQILGESPQYQGLPSLVKSLKILTRLPQRY